MEGDIITRRNFLRSIGMFAAMDAIRGPKSIYARVSGQEATPPAEYTYGSLPVISSQSPSIIALAQTRGWFFKERESLKQWNKERKKPARSGENRIYRVAALEYQRQIAQRLSVVYDGLGTRLVDSNNQQLITNPVLIEDLKILALATIEHESGFDPYIESRPDKSGTSAKGYGQYNIASGVSDAYELPLEDTDSQFCTIATILCSKAYQRLGKQRAAELLRGSGSLTVEDVRRIAMAYRGATYANEHTHNISSTYKTVSAIRDEVVNSGLQPGTHWSTQLDEGESTAFFNALNTQYSFNESRFLTGIDYIGAPVNLNTRYTQDASDPAKFTVTYS